MNVKYYAKDMQEALAKIKKELGDEAKIVSNKQIRSKKGIFGLFSPKVYEVIAEYDPATMRKAKLAQRQAERKAEKDQKQEEQQKQEKIEKAVLQIEKAEKKNDKQTIEELDKKIDNLTSVIANFSSKFEYLKKDVSYDYIASIENVLIKMIDNDVEEVFAHEICKKAQEYVSKKGVVASEAVEHIVKEMLGDIKIIEPSKFERKTIMIIGPTGVGKTTTLVKLASYFVVKKELKVGVINTDVYRVAAQEQLKTYCDILNVPMKTVYKPEEMKDALSEFEEMDIVFVDTAGKVSSDIEYQKDIQEFIDTCNINEIYLALCGSCSSKILKETIDNYEFLKRHNIIVTKMDEGINNGVLINISKYSGRPLSYITDGQSVPDDIKEVDINVVCSGIVR